MPFNFSWLIPGRIAGMGRPQAQNATWLQDRGVTAILTLTERLPSGFDAFEHAHIPVRDFTAPTLDELHRGVKFLMGVAGQGGAAVVHCAAGIGRTGTFLAAYLVGSGRSAQEAILEVRRLRPGSIETAAQETAIHQYAELVGGSGT